jgi:hypothetical protein
MKIENRTPHAIALKHEDCVRVIEPTRPPVRVSSRLGKPDWTENGITVHHPSKGVKLQNLPPPVPDTLLVVSQICAIVAAKQHPDRVDLVYPATSVYHGAERGDGGVITVQRLIRAS